MQSLEVNRRFGETLPLSSVSKSKQNKTLAEVGSIQGIACCLIHHSFLFGLFFDIENKGQMFP
jgi:hypothetical protein